MKYKSLHEIVNSVLLQKGYSIHWYMQVLKFSSDCLRELSFDVTGNVRSKKIELTDRGTVELPCDYVDYVRIGTPYWGNVRSLGTVLKTNHLVNLDSTGNVVPYGGTEWAYDGNCGSWVYPDGIHYHHMHLGQGFTIETDRNEIQFTHVRSNPGFIILDYITDGSEIDNAVQVHPYAQACIEAYCFWQLKAKNRSFNPGDANNDKMEYDRQYRILRGRKSDVTPANVRSSMMRYYNKQA